MFSLQVFKTKSEFDTTIQHLAQNFENLDTDFSEGATTIVPKKWYAIRASSRMVDFCRSLFQMNPQFLASPTPALRSLKITLSALDPAFDQIGVTARERIPPPPPNQATLNTLSYLAGDNHPWSLPETFEMCCCLHAREDEESTLALFESHSLQYLHRTPVYFSGEIEKRLNIPNDPIAGLFLSSLCKSSDRFLITPLPLLRTMLSYASKASRSEEQLLLGLCFSFGYGEDQNYEKAFHHFQEAYRLGNSEGAVEIGNCYWFGFGVGLNRETAFQYYNKAALKGNSNAYVCLGNCYWAKNEKDRALGCYHKAASIGNAEAEVEIGNYHSLEQRSEEAKMHYEKAVKMGSSHAYVELGKYYWDRGTYQTAFSYYSQAAKMGNPMGFLGMAKCYRLGKGALQQPAKVLECWEKASNLGHQQATWLVVQTLIKDQCSSQDLSRGTPFLLKLVRQNHKEAIQLHRKISNLHHLPSTAPNIPETKTCE